MTKENSFIQLIKDTVVEVMDKKYESADDLDDRMDEIEDELKEVVAFNNKIENRLNDFKIGKGFATKKVHTIEINHRIDKIENELEEKDAINNNIENRLSDLENNVNMLLMSDKFLRFGEEKERIFPKYSELKLKESIKNIKDSLDNIEGTWKFHNMQGAPWHVVEKKTLKKEIEFTIKTIAANHGRTEKAIKARLVKIGALDY